MLVDVLITLHENGYLDKQNYRHGHPPLSAKLQHKQIVA